MPSLADQLAAVSAEIHTGRPCTFAARLAGLDPAQRDEIIDATRRDDVSPKILAAHLQSIGITVTADTVKRHRRGSECLSCKRAGWFA